MGRLLADRAVVQELQLDRFWPIVAAEPKEDTVGSDSAGARQLSADRAGQRVAAASPMVRHQRDGRFAGADFGLAEEHKLYACHDLLLEHKEALFSHLVGRWRDLFNADFDVLLYDLTSTYFEVNASELPEGSKRRHGTAATSGRTARRW